MSQRSSSSSYPPYDQSLNPTQTYHQHIMITAEAEKIAINTSRKWWNNKLEDKKEGSGSKMMVQKDQTMNRFEDHHHQKQPLLLSSSSPSTDDHNNISCSNSSCSNSDQTHDIIRVCADCRTTKTPLWRTGPTGPKSLCNACGIRQRKARRIMMAAGAAASAPARESELWKKKKMKKKKKACEGRRKEVVIEELGTRLSKNLCDDHKQQVLFPHHEDENEAAILLMALSYGLVRG